MNNGLVGYFGYGSLVNRDTLSTDYVTCRPARLKGWRRHWQSRGSDVEPARGGDLALLTVHAHAPSSILGMVVVDRAHNLASVDRREARYDRVTLEHSSIEVMGGEAASGSAELPDTLFLYVGRRQREPDNPPHLLQSYLDAVMAGFLNEFGEDGVLHFLETTVGFERPIVRDRARPRYSRAIAIDDETAQRFDGMLKVAGVRFA